LAGVEPGFSVPRADTMATALHWLPGHYNLFFVLLAFKFL
jgi:hypothetical protein